MNDKNIEQQSGSQKEINKLFLKACKEDDIETVKYLLTSKELTVNAQLSITKQTGFSNDKKDGFVPLVLAVQYNAKNVYKYFLEDIDWFSKLTYEAKVEVVSKGTYSNDIQTIEYLFKKFESSGKVSGYQKPFTLDKILESVIDKNSDKVFEHLMFLPNEYKAHLNTKNDSIFMRAAISNNNMLSYMLNHNVYNNLSVELYINAFEAAKKNPETSLTLFKYGIEKNMFDIWLTKKNSSYIRDKVRDCVFKTFNESVINYIHEEQTKLSYPQRLVELANENIRDYFFTEDEVNKYKNNQNVAPVLEYAIKNKLLSKESKEQIVFNIIKFDYKNLLEIICNYPQYGEDLDLTSSFVNCIHKNNIGKSKYKKIEQILNIDIEKNIKVDSNESVFFYTLENMKGMGQNHDEMVKKVFMEYDFWPAEIMEEIYENNPTMLKLVNMKVLNMKLSKQADNEPVSKTKINKI